MHQRLFLVPTKHEVGFGAMQVNMPHLIERFCCAITGCSDLELLHEAKCFSIFMRCADSPASQDMVADMRWSISRSPGLIQLSNLIPLEALYPESHGSGGVGRLWNTHHNAFARCLSRTAPGSVLEIGGAHGIFAGIQAIRPDPLDNPRAQPLTGGGL